MLIHCIIAFQNKCARYWPEEGEIAEYGGTWKVNALSCTVTADYTLREFLLQGNKPNFTVARRIFHYHFQVIIFLSTIDYSS